MKIEKGITLVSLVIYVVIMVLVIGVMSSVSVKFYKNTQSLDDDTTDLIEFTNFNNYFIKEIKIANNKIDQISEDGTYILFRTGNSFSLKGNSIFYNNIEISKNVNKLQFLYDKDSEGNDIIDVVKMTIEYENYSKEMKYKIEEIY